MFLVEFVGPMGKPAWGTEPDFPKYVYSSMKILRVFKIRDSLPLDQLVERAKSGQLERVK